MRTGKIVFGPRATNAADSIRFADRARERELEDALRDAISRLAAMRAPASELAKLQAVLGGAR